MSTRKTKKKWRRFHWHTYPRNRVEVVGKRYGYTENQIYQVQKKDRAQEGVRKHKGKP